MVTRGVDALMLVGADHLDEDWMLLIQPRPDALAGRPCDRIGHAEPFRVHSSTRGPALGMIGQNNKTGST
jgi:hypothetical protein